MQRLSEFYEGIFGAKTYKLSLDAGCTCPNRDGRKGYGGCIFCSENGSGDFASEKNLSVKDQVEKAKALVENKIRGRGKNREGKYIAYFQNFSSTYGETDALVKKYMEALSCKDVVGLSLATRPDCLSDQMLSELSKIAENHFLQIELGLQTSNEKTGTLINRCYTNLDYIDAVKRIRCANKKIHVVTHLIFGLPGEEEKDMLDSVNFVLKENEKASFFGIKITVLYILQNTKLASLYEEGKINPLSKEEYFSLVKKAVELLPETCVVHRLTGDPPKKILIAPKWPEDKKRVLNELNEVLKRKVN